MQNAFRRRCWLWAFGAGAAVAQDMLWKLYNNAGKEAWQEGRYAEAEKMFLAALEVAERFGSQDTRLATPNEPLAHQIWVGS